MTWGGGGGLRCNRRWATVDSVGQGAVDWNKDEGAVGSGGGGRRLELESEAGSRLGGRGAGVNMT
jgi:hypothetical protein